MPKKYSPENLLPALRVFVTARRKILDAEFTDNGGAIHSIERVVDLLSEAVVYPHLTHINSLKKDPNADCSVEAHRARERGEKVLIEHVAPKRAFSRSICDLIEKHQATDSDLINYISNNYHLVLLTPEETKKLNKINRSKMSPTRLEEAGIILYSKSADPKK